MICWQTIWRSVVQTTHLSGEKSRPLLCIILGDPSISLSEISSYDDLISRNIILYNMHRIEIAHIKLNESALDYHEKYVKDLSFNNCLSTLVERICQNDQKATKESKSIYWPSKSIVRDEMNPFSAFKKPLEAVKDLEEVKDVVDPPYKHYLSSIFQYPFEYYNITLLQNIIFGFLWY